MITTARPRSPPPQVGKQRDYLSFSAIRTYQSCPLRFFFRYVAGLPEKTISTSLVFGSGIHRAIEHHYRELLQGNTPPTVAELFAEYQHEWREREAAGVAIGKEKGPALHELAQRMLLAFTKHEMALPAGKVLGIEEELRGPLVPGVPDLLGKLDLIVETPTELVISDWKTSRTRWQQSDVNDAAEQLLLYSELVKDFAPGKRVRLEFAVLTKTKEVCIQRESLLASQRGVDRIKRVVERVWKAISAEHFYPAPSPMNCGSCSFREPCRRWTG